MDNKKLGSILLRYRDSDARAFSEFFELTHPIIYSYLVSRLGNKVDADDAVQEFYLRIHRFVLKFDDTQNPWGWLFTIGRNVAADVRKRTYGLPITDTDKHARPSLEEARLAAQDELVQLLKELPDTDSQLLMDRFVKEQTFEEIATNLNTTPANARQRLSRLLRKIREV